MMKNPGQIFPPRCHEALLKEQRMESTPHTHTHNNHIFTACYLTVGHLALCVQGPEEARDLDSLSLVPVLTRPALGEYG